MKNYSKKGFTLAELLIVVAIIGVLVSISIPIFTNILERSRDAVSVANIRNAYALATSEYITCNISDSHTDGLVYSHFLYSGGEKIGTVNFRNRKIVQICIYDVELKGTKSNDWSGLADNLPFHDNIEPGDTNPPGPYMFIFNFDDNGSGQTNTATVTGTNWDSIDTYGLVTSISIRQKY